MFNAKSVSLLKKREGILGQFKKAVDGLVAVNEEIDYSVGQSVMRKSDLEDKVKAEEAEMLELMEQKAKNSNTIKKMKEFLN